jgi:sulfonate transport system ATP-binding protein
MATHTVRLTPVRVRGLVRGYGPKGVLNGVDLDIAPGEFVALLGPSGCGKSTLLRALAGLDHAVSGSGTVDVPDKVSVVFQDSRLLPWDTVLGNVTLGLTEHDAAQRGRRALDALTRLKMHGLLAELVSVHQPSVLLVTHDVDEAIALADRIVVLDHGQVALERRVASGSNRTPHDPGFARLHSELLDALGVTRHLAVAAART